MPGNSETCRRTLYAQGLTEPKMGGVAYWCAGSISVPQKSCLISATKQKDGDMCKNKPSKQFVGCASSVMYEIPVICVKACVGQKAWCYNDGAREHAVSLRNSHSGILAIHCDKCPSAPDLQNANILGKLRHKMWRKVSVIQNQNARGSQKHGCPDCSFNR